MSLSLQFLQERAKSELQTVTTKNATIENNLSVIQSCTEQSPTVIARYKQWFERYKQDTKNPSTWRRIEIAIAKKIKGKTETEKNYKNAREELRSLALLRNKSTKGLQVLTGWNMPREKLVKHIGSMDEKMIREAEQEYYETIIQSEKKEDFETLIQNKGLSETIEKIEILDTYLTTNPSYEDMYDTLTRMTNSSVIRALALHMMEKFPEKTLDILALEHVYETSFLEKYFDAFKKEYERQKSPYTYVPPDQDIIYKELSRHTLHPDIYTKIINEYIPTSRHDSLDMYKFKKYVKLPLHIQKIIYQKIKHSAPEFAASFGQVVVENMNEREKARLILQRNTKERPFIEEAFSKKDKHSAAIAYLDGDEKYDYWAGKAVTELSEDEKKYYAKKMLEREEDATFFRLFMDYVSGEDLDTAIKLLKKTGQSGTLQELMSGIIQKQETLSEIQKNLIEEYIIETVFREEKTCRFWLKDMGAKLDETNEKQILETEKEKLIPHIFVKYFVRNKDTDDYGKNQTLGEQAENLKHTHFYEYASGLIRAKIEERLCMLQEREKIKEKLIA